VAGLDLTTSAKGKVYLVGAGPGDPELLTLKGLRALKEADVVVYDRLANPRLLENAPAEAELVYVGKEAQRHASPQEDINALLVERALAGKTVCRLKGGDPFVFGRGGEEAETLAAAGVEWEYVPGISSAIAAPGYAGIPVTHRGLCSTFTVVTAHEDPSKGGSTLNWAALAALDTVVFLMGVERLDHLTVRLMEHGRAPETPVAVVSWGTYPRQATVEGTLATITDLARAASLSPPAVTIVGQVAAKREVLRWFDNRPLFGKRIVVTRPREQAEALGRLIEAAGAEAIYGPAIRIRRLPHPDLMGLGEPYDWVVFTSANGVNSLRSSLKEADLDIRALGRARIAAIGPETARSAECAGLRVDFVPSRYVAEQVAAEFPEPLGGKRVLIPRAKEAREVLPELWRERGATVDVLPVYESVPDVEGAARLRERLAAGEVDAVTFTASSTVRSFLPLLVETGLRESKVVCIGPITAETAREAGFPVDAVADEYTSEGVLEALERVFADPLRLGVMTRD
jgi:uroporphyrinogen III methyltransferase / synthase